MQRDRIRPPNQTKRAQKQWPPRSTLSTPTTQTSVPLLPGRTRACWRTEWLQGWAWGSVRWAWNISVPAERKCLRNYEDRSQDTGASLKGYPLDKLCPPKQMINTNYIPLNKRGNHKSILTDQMNKITFQWKENICSFDRPLHKTNKWP